LKLKITSFIADFSVSKTVHYQKDCISDSCWHRIHM